MNQKCWILMANESCKGVYLDESLVNKIANENNECDVHSIYWWVNESEIIK